MVRKKEYKKPSAKEEKPVKSEDNKKIFDDNGKLIISKIPEKSSEHDERVTNGAVKKSEKKLLTDAERQEAKRKYWNDYYHRPGNPEKYKLWNAKWRKRKAAENKQLAKKSIATAKQ